MRYIILLFLSIVFISCYGPVRFATSTNGNGNGKPFFVDSLRISRAINTQSDTTLRFATDLEFTEEELREIISSEEEVKPIENITDFFARYGNIDTNNSIPTNYEKFLMTIISYLGTPYKFGGTSRKGIDCSAFTRLIFQESLNIELPRSTLEQVKLGYPVSRKDLQFGDLVFFNTRRRQNPGHVGIYLWDNYFVHASTKYGVIVSSMASGYYDRRFVGARRLDEVYSLTNAD
ncbi:MAG: NlpC/P60 family protein [Ignavibacteria bacterium]|nr:NlpC/P60 family protein [Ignavibacteria bacterium]